MPVENDSKVRGEAVLNVEGKSGHWRADVKHVHLQGANGSKFAVLEEDVCVESIGEIIERSCLRYENVRRRWRSLETRALV